MDRLDRSTVVLVAIALTVGFAAWQLLSAVGYVVAELLIDLWSEGEETFVAQFSIGGADIQYGQLLASAITLLAALLTTALLLRRTAGWRTGGTPTS